MSVKGRQQKCMGHKASISVGGEQIQWWLVQWGKRCFFVQILLQQPNYNINCYYILLAIIHSINHQTQKMI